jgi:hypothetical protein
MLHNPPAGAELEHIDHGLGEQVTLRNHHSPISKHYVTARAPAGCNNRLPDEYFLCHLQFLTTRLCTHFMRISSNLLIRELLLVDRPECYHFQSCVIGDYFHLP